MSKEGDTLEVDLEQHPTAKALVSRCIEFLNEIANL